MPSVTRLGGVIGGELGSSGRFPLGGLPAGEAAHAALMERSGQQFSGRPGGHPVELLQCGELLVGVVGVGAGRGRLTGRTSGGIG